jgi:RNA recognition motif-containing protein
MTARLYVGGLPPDISAADVIGRFTTFGNVSSCELVPSKGLQGAPGTCRGFAYVDLQPKDDHAVARCLSLVRKLLHNSLSYLLVQPACQQGP